MATVRHTANIPPPPPPSRPNHYHPRSATAPLPPSPPSADTKENKKHIHAYTKQGAGRVSTVNFFSLPSHLAPDCRATTNLSHKQHKYPRSRATAADRSSNQLAPRHLNRKKNAIFFFFNKTPHPLTPLTHPSLEGGRGSGTKRTVVQTLNEGLSCGCLCVDILDPTHSTVHSRSTSQRAVWINQRRRTSWRLFCFRAFRLNLPLLL